MDHQQARCMSGGSKMLTETGFTNYWHDRRMLGESKKFEIETGLMNLERISARQVKVKYLIPRRV